MGPITRVTEATVDVLDSLLTEREPIWGLAIAKRTERTPASIYPILNRLESGGWIEGSWEVESDRPGPRRRLYRLTDTGRVGAQQVVDEFRRRRARPARPEPRLA